MPLLAINHHYYREFGTGRGIHPTTPRMLSEEVLKIRAAGWRIGTEDDIFSFLSGRLAADDKVAILTFDDGLAEQMAALRQLEAQGASAIFYVPTAPIVDHIVLDVHKLQMIRARVEDAQIAIELDKTFSFGKTDFDDDLLAIQYRYDDELARKVKYFLNFTLDHDARQAWTNEYFATLFGAEREVSASLYMSSDDLRRLSEKRLLGSHAHSHLPLATLCGHRMQYELLYSRRLIEEMTDSVPASVSYPFGGKSAVGDHVFDCASACGYVYGFTMERGINDLPDKANPMALRRIDINDLDRWLDVESGLIDTLD